MKTIRIFIMLILGIIINSEAFGQIVNFSPTADTTTKVVVEGYVDTYFNFDFAQPKDSNIPYFVSHNRHNEFNINLAYLSLKYYSNKARAVFTPGFGTYMNSNYAVERITLRNIVEANVGACLSQKRNIWIDVGVMTSPFTNESAISFDQPTLTRCFAAENVPYYLSGARLSVPIMAKLNINLFLLNGWQAIEDVNDPLAFASQFDYKPTDKLTITLNTYYGYERSSRAIQNRLRTFLDLFAVYKAEKLHLSACGYIGNQKRKDSLDIASDNIWWQANATARYFISPQHSFTIRGEYFNDPKSVMIIPITSVQGFKCGSISLGYNCAITPSVLFRVEGRYFQSPDKVFIKGNNNTNNFSTLTGGLTVKI